MRLSTLEDILPKVKELWAKNTHYKDCKDPVLVTYFPFGRNEIHIEVGDDTTAYVLYCFNIDSGCFISEIKKKEKTLHLDEVPGRF